MLQVRVSGSYNPKPGDYDGMHSFESRASDGFGGKMNTKVNAALKNFYKTNKLNPSVSAINIVMDDTNWVVKWEVLIEESTDGKAYIGLTSRGGAGPKPSSTNRAQSQYDAKIIALKTEVNPKTETKKILDFLFTPKVSGWGIRQIFAAYTNPVSYPPYPPSTPQPASSTVIDSTTNQPIQSAQAQVETSITEQPIQNFGELIDQNAAAEQSLQVEIPPAPTSTNPEDLPKVLISAPGYESTEVVPYKGDGTVKTDLGVISLTPTNVALEQDKIKASQLTTDQIKEISKGDKGINYYSQERLSNQINTLKTVLIPTVLTLIAGFGVTKASDLITQNQSKISDAVKNKSTCPTPIELTSIISKKNKLVKQLDNSLKTIDATTKALGITQGIIVLLDATLFTADNTPTSINPFTLGFNKFLSKRIDQLKLGNAGILSILLILRQVLTQALQLLNLLDALVQKCYPDAEQERISLELTALTLQQSVQLSPVVTNINGFEMGVETENSPNTLKRRRAIARNKQGVVMLKGEWSFSSIDQILIDELVFYIQQNDLKAD